MTASGAPANELDDGIGARTRNGSERTGCLAQFGQVQWHSPGAPAGAIAASKLAPSAPEVALAGVEWRGT